MLCHVDKTVTNVSKEHYLLTQKKKRHCPRKRYLPVQIRVVSIHAVNTYAGSTGIAML
jgi:hypothetical protein